MKAHRFWTLALVVAFVGCSNDNPTGLSHVETIDGVAVTRVADLGMFQVMRHLVADEDLTCSVIGFEDFVAGSTHDPALINVLGASVSIDISDFTDSVDDCGTGVLTIFDTDGTTSTGDGDLELAGKSVVPNLGKVAIHQSCESDGIGEPFEPNDADVLSTMEFSFPPAPDGNWVVKSFVALDQEGFTDGEWIQLWTDGSFAKSTNINVDNGNAAELVVVDVNAAFNSTLEFEFNGSGAIDNIEVCQIINRGGEGCTPGYWKQSQHFGSWPVDPATTTFGAVFGGACGVDQPTLKGGADLCTGLLLDALSAKGGGINALARHAAAAWLNSASSVEFHYLQSEVETMVEAAFFSGVYQLTKDAFDEANNAGCPLGNSGPFVP